MNNRLSFPRVLLLALLTAAIIVAIFAAAVYAHNYSSMREADIEYNTGNYENALARYRSLGNSIGFRDEATKKADYCNYQLGVKAMEAENWEEAQQFFAAVENYDPENVEALVEQCKNEIVQRDNEIAQQEAEEKQHQVEERQHQVEEAQHQAEEAQREAEEKWQHEVEEAQREADEKQHEAEEAQREAEEAQREADELEKANSADVRFLTDLRKAITSRLQDNGTTTDASFVNGDLFVLYRYSEEEFSEPGLRDYANQYLDALQLENTALSEATKADEQLLWVEGETLRHNVLENLYLEYGFMADDYDFIREYVANTGRVAQREQMIKVVSQDIQAQTSGVENWATTNGYSATHLMRNNTPYTISVTFYFDIYNNNGTMYEGQDSFHIDDVPPGADYRIVLNDVEIQNFIKFYIDWEITDVK